MSLSTSPILAAAASNDVAATRWLIEHERVHVDQMGDWFAPQGGFAESHGETRGVAPHASSMGLNGVPSHAVNKHVSLERKRRTPLMVAATHGSVDALSYLLNAGADPNFRSDDDERAIFIQGPRRSYSFATWSTAPPRSPFTASRARRTYERG